MIDVRILATGSSGNCVLIGNTVLVDAGITFKHFCEFGIPLTQLRACIVTHKHGDHMNKPFVRRLLENQIPVYMSEDSAADLQMEGKIDVEQCVDENRIRFLDDERIRALKGGGDWTLYGTHDGKPNPLTIIPHPQKHHDIINYALVFEDKEERLLYSTDLDSLEPTDKGEGLMHLGMFDTILLEGNYDELYLRSYIEYMISIAPEAENPGEMDKDELELWVKRNYRLLPNDVKCNAFRAIQNYRHLSKQQARAYAATHLKPGGRYYEIHRSSTFYEEPVGWKEEM